MELLSGYHGIDLFDLDRQELERLLGRDEGKHLDSLLTVQKSNCGVSEVFFNHEKKKQLHGTDVIKTSLILISGKSNIQSYE